MARGQGLIQRTSTPNTWLWQWDNLSSPNDAIDNFATAANPSAALDALKPFATGLPGSLSKITVTVESFEGP